MEEQIEGFQAEIEKLLEKNEEISSLQGKVSELENKNKEIMGQLEGNSSQNLEEF